MTHLDDYELRESLEHGTRKERYDIAVALGDAGKGDPMTLGALARAVWQDESRAVRRAAAESLYRLGDAGFEMLRRMLIEDSVKMRLMIESFSRLGDAYYYHFQELEERDKRAHKSIIEALGNFKDKRAVRAMIDVLEKEDAVGRGKTYKEWNYQSNLHWSYVSEHLGRIADTDIDTLLDALENGCKVTRMCVADALGAIENADEHVVSALIEALKFDKKNDLLSTVSAKSLGKLGDRRAVPMLIECLNSSSAHAEAARALGKIGDKSAVPALIKALPHENAAYALGKIGDESAIPALKEALNQEIEWMVEAAEANDYYTPDWKSARALCEFGDVGLDAIVDIVKPHVKDRGSFDELIEMAREEHPDTDWDDEDSPEWKLCYLYNKLDDEPVIIPILLYLMKYGYPEIGVVAAQMIYLLGDKNIYLLFDLLKDDDIRVRKAAASLGSQYPEYLEEHIDFYFDVDLEADETDPLLEALKDDDWDVRHNISEMFSKLIISGFPDIGYVINDFIYLIEDPNPDVRGAAAEAFYRLGLLVQGSLPDQELERIIKTLLGMSEDENVRDVLRNVQEDHSWDEWHEYSPDVISPIVIEMLMKNRNLALLGGGLFSDNIVIYTLNELFHEVWDIIIQVLYDKNRHAIDAFDDFSRSALPDSTAIDALIETLNDNEAKAIDRKISAVVLGMLRNRCFWRIDDIRRDSDRISSALSVLATDVDVDKEVRDTVLSMVKVTDVNRDDTKLLDELFHEYHKSGRSEPNERQ
ncbi:MAG: hypothetical protein GWP10_14375 [Nitrospiraceae bacterium]|nr:hypothetical protein [Nitrospiraceae bacterium]